MMTNFTQMLILITIEPLWGSHNFAFASGYLKTRLGDCR